MLYNNGILTDSNGNATIICSQKYMCYTLCCDQYSTVTIWQHYTDSNITIHSDPNKTVNLTLYGIYYG